METQIDLKGKVKGSWMGCARQRDENLRDNQKDICKSLRTILMVAQSDYYSWDMNSM